MRGKTRTSGLGSGRGGGVDRHSRDESENSSSLGEHHIEIRKIWSGGVRRMKGVKRDV